MKIVKIYLEHLRSEAHYQFMILVRKLFGTWSIIMNIIADLLSEFDRLILLEGQLVDTVKASKYTEQLVELDSMLDKYLIGFNSAVKAAMHHFNPAIVEAAKAVEVRMRPFRGSIEKRSYEEEAAAVKILVADLNGPQYQSLIATLGLGEWVTAIAQTQDEFEQLFILRNSELANRPHEQLLEVRKQLNIVYRAIIARIEAHILLDGEYQYREFVAELNREVVYFNEHSHHYVKKDIGKADVASINDQPYTGEPVIVLPEVTFEGEKLVFSTDFEVSYKNNIKPGTVTLIIHGKRHFKSTKTVTFNIYGGENK
jgi:hypothetical protein